MSFGPMILIGTFHAYAYMKRGISRIPITEIPVFGPFASTCGCSRSNESAISCVWGCEMARVVEPESAKKPYEPPILTVYGAVHHITKHNRQGHALDNGGSGSSIFTGLA